MQLCRAIDFTYIALASLPDQLEILTESWLFCTVDHRHIEAGCKILWTRTSTMQERLFCDQQNTLVTAMIIRPKQGYKYPSKFLPTAFAEYITSVWIWPCRKCLGAFCWWLMLWKYLRAKAFAVVLSHATDVNLVCCVKKIVKRLHVMLAWDGGVAITISTL